MYIEVDGMNWTVSKVAESADADAFVQLHIADEGIYPTHDVERKERALRLVYSQCCPDMTVPTKPKKAKKEESEPKDEE